jgi:methylglutaconyl-CoA hydratase
MEVSVITHTENGIHTITFSHPAQNSMPSYQLNALEKEIEKAGENPDVRVIVLKSGGEKTFCAGASFVELAAISDFESGHKFFSGFSNVINACRKSPKIIIGRIQGKAVGGGVGIASAVDYCYATQAASIRLSELAVGFGPFVIGPAVQRKVGLSAFSALSIHPNKWMSAEWAREKGLYAEVYENIELMDEAISSHASLLSSYSVEALGELKKIFWDGTMHWDQLLYDRAAISGRLALSEFTRNAIEAFKAKG